MPEKNELPEGWVNTQMKDIGNYINGRAFKPSDWEKSGRPIIRIQNLTGSKGTVNYYSKPVEERYLVQDKDLLISWSATLDAFIYHGPEAVLNQHIFRVESKIEKLFHYYLVKHYIFKLMADVHGSGMQHITKGKFDKIEIPLPPLPEQQRIVEAIGAIFSRLDAAEARLERVPEIMKHFQQSVLAAACDGRLTEGWRAENPEMESAKDLLKKAESHQEGEKKKSAGRLWGAGVVHGLSSSEINAIPKEWTWIKIKNLEGNSEKAVQIGPMSMRSKDFCDEGIPVLNVGCVQWGEFNEAKLNYLPKELANQFTRYKIQKNDILFTRSGTIGRCAIATQKQEGYLMTFHLLRVRVFDEICIPDYIFYVFMGAPHIRKQMEDAAIGSTRAGFNTRLLEELDIPLPPLPQQKEIVRRVDAHIALADKIQKQAASAKERTEKLRQSVLAQAFSGRLVETEAEIAGREGRSYESAGELLERIRGAK